MRITLISGSARTNNNTMRVAKALGRVLGPEHAIRIIDFVNYDIPLMAQGGMDMMHPTPFQKELIDGIDEAHIVVIISPEYNWSTTPEILNMLHYLPNKPYQNLFNNKVFAMVGVSTGKGGKTPALHLMQILNKLISFGKWESIVSSRIFESHFTKEVLDQDGNSLGNAMYDEGLKDFCDYTVRMATRWFK